MNRRAKRITRPLREEDRVKYQRLREQLEQEKSAILELARRLKAEQDAANSELLDTCQLLKKERERQGLSLSDIEERTGITRSALSRLEKHLVISLADRAPAAAG